MPVLLYARVSTSRQAERELSIPAQVRLCRQYAADHGLVVAGVYHDVGSGTSLKGRVGLMAAIRHARTETTIDGLLVHKIDRVARNVFTYVALKAKLRASGVRIQSVVETIETNPMGEFIEHIMAAQAEFYSANLAAEVKKGLEERLLRGLWSGTPPIGYVSSPKGLLLDPARARFVRMAFELWNTGTYSARRLVERLHSEGFVSRRGRMLYTSQLLRFLQNPLYCGRMVVRGREHRGSHPPIVTPAMFERAQEVFRQKRGDGLRPRGRLTFLLAGKVRCAWCRGVLTGEHHEKRGKAYRYYRCHEAGCRFTVRAADLERNVHGQLVQLNLAERLAPMLKCRHVHANDAGGGDDRPETKMAFHLQVLPMILQEPVDMVRARQVVGQIVDRVELGAQTPTVHLVPELRALVGPPESSKSYRVDRVGQVN